MANTQHTPGPYYVRNKDAGYLGNSWLWWAIDAAGYTAYLNNAERMTFERASEICARNPTKFDMYLCDHIDQKIQFVFDSQDHGRLGTPDCGFKNTVDARLLMPQIRHWQKLIDAMVNDDVSNHHYTGLTYLGVPVEEMTKGQLIDALAQMTELTQTLFKKKP
jgi:hypothetical protein